MTHSIKASRQARPLLLGAERRAFDNYLRWGRVPLSTVAAKAASRELKALGEARPTAYYTWRTANDERVRDSHAANDGQVFGWDNPPATGHPGHERNCRCWAEPYYGTPFISDTTLALSRRQRSDPTGLEPWQLIETLTRPDGTLAESRILMRDGTRIVSTFNGGLVVNEVTLPDDGRVVRVQRRDGVQSIFVGESLKPSVLSAWTASGPRIAVPRVRVAFEGAFDLMPRRIRPDRTIIGSPPPYGDIETLDPNSPLTSDLGGSAAAIGLALLVLYLASQADRESVGAGTNDRPALTIRIWAPSGKLTPMPVGVTSLTAEQVTQNCRRLPEVQQWTDRAAIALAGRRQGQTASQWGTAVHKRIKDEFDALKERYPLTYIDTFAEYSLTPQAEETRYGRMGSSRLDIVERRDEVVCIYDIKTGRSGITANQLARAAAIAVAYNRLTFYIIEVRPSP